MISLLGIDPFILKRINWNNKIEKRQGSLTRRESYLESLGEPEATNDAHLYKFSTVIWVLAVENTTTTTTRIKTTALLSPSYISEISGFSTYLPQRYWPLSLDTP